MKVGDIYKKLDELSPFELQESWDNSGLQVGSMYDEVDQIVLSIDIDDELLSRVEPDTLLITHHPLIFGGIKRFDTDTFPPNFIKKMIAKNISAIAMHTNFDITHLNDYVATEVLGLEIEKKKGFLAYMRVESDFEVFARKVQDIFKLDVLKAVRCHDKIESVALCTGSGASMLRDVKADLFLTGDIKYHDAMLAKALGISMIDIGHYESEHFFASILAKELKNLGIQAIISQSVNPFIYI